MRRAPLLAAVAIALVAAAWVLFGRSAPEAVDVSAPAPAAPAAPLAPGTPALPEAPGSDAAPITDPSGDWIVRTDLVPFDGAQGAGSWVGYRIDEVLASVGDFTAVGRTPQVGGTVRVEGTEVRAATITADLGALRSDSGLRDGQVRRILGDRPAVFELTTPLVLAAVPAPGATELVTAPGRLRIGDVERDVVFELAVSLDGQVLVVRGATEVVLADFDVTVPSVPVVVSVADTLTVELQLLLTRD